MRKNSYKNETIWIIGASSGIGAALTRELAIRGAHLIISSRRADELEKLCSSLGGNHKTFTLDITDAEAVKLVTKTIHSSSECVDRVIILAAAYAPMKIEALDGKTTKQIIDINLIGTFNILETIIPLFKKQKSRGQIVLCGSVAGYMGLPGGQPYSATKAAIINLAESLYAECEDNFDVKLISPGFVRTPLTDKNNFKMPMIIEPEQAAREIADGLLSKSFEIHFPKRFTTFLKFLRLLPYALSLPITHKIKN